MKGGLWIGDNICTDKKISCSDDLTSRRIFAISKVPSLVGTCLATMLPYGFFDLNNVTIIKNSPLSIEFYLDNPYLLDPILSNPVREFFWLRGARFDDPFGRRIINKHGLSYAVEHKKSIDTIFIKSLSGTKDKLYDNGNINVWSLD